MWVDRSTLSVRHIIPPSNADITDVPYRWFYAEDFKELKQNGTVRDWPEPGPGNRTQIHTSRMVIARGPESDVIGETEEIYVDEGGVCKSIVPGYP